MIPRRRFLASQVCCHSRLDLPDGVEGDRPCHYDGGRPTLAQPSGRPRLYQGGKVFRPIVLMNASKTGLLRQRISKRASLVGVRHAPVACVTWGFEVNHGGAHRRRS